MDNWRRYVLTHRVASMETLFTCYDLYSQMMSYGIMSGINNPVESAERFSRTINALFKANSKPSDFIINNDDCSNKAIDCYNSLKKILDVNEGDKDAIWAFCKAMYHYPKYTWMRGDGYIYMRAFVSRLLDYLLGIITKRQLEESFVIYRLWDGGKKQKANFALARKTFMQVEDLFWSIKCKQIVRKEKKENGI